MLNADIEDLLRELAPQVLGALVRRYGHFDIAEDAVQEALLAAATRWPGSGRPDNPRGWLITVASRRMTDLLRSEQSRQRREDTVASWTLPEQFVSPPPDAASPAERDDSLILLFMCCHPDLSPPSAIALTLRAVGGLTTAEIARAFLVPEATMAQRISRAKQRVKAGHSPFTLPPQPLRSERLNAVLHVLYLIFTEGYTATFGPNLVRDDLSGEAIRLTRIVHRLLPEDGEVAGLLALMLLTDARRPARTDANGEPVPLAEQDRSRWNAEYIAEGVALITAAMARPPVGPYRLQAAIAAVHDVAAGDEDTDWAQIVALYEGLLHLSDNPVTRLNHAVAVAMATGATAGLDLLPRIADDKRMAKNHRLHAVRAHLLEMDEQVDAAHTEYLLAARLATSMPEKRYLNARAAHLKQ